MEWNNYSLVIDLELKDHQFGSNQCYFSWKPLSEAHKIARKNPKQTKTDQLDLWFK